MQSKRNILISIVLLLVLVILSIGAFFYFLPKGAEKTDQPSKPAELTSPNIAVDNARVFITEEGFDKKEVKVKVGGAVTFTNSGSQNHEIASAVHPQHTDYADLNLGEIKPFESKILIFPQAGTYRYHDHLNPQFTGTIIVQ